MGERERERERERGEGVIERERERERERVGSVWLSLGLSGAPGVPWGLSGLCLTLSETLYPTTLPKATRELPRELLEHPGSVPKASQEDPRASRRPLGVVSGASGPHFGASETYFSIIVEPSSDPTAHLCSLFSPRSSLPSSLFFLGPGTWIEDWGPRP